MCCKVSGMVLAVAMVCYAVVAQAVNIDLVPVGNAGNAQDTRYGSNYTGNPSDPLGYGGVAYVYNIGKYEVSTRQYTEFLNAVAAADTYGLYNTSMDTVVNSFGCNIKRTGSSGSYTYSVASDWANRPVNYVSWGDAARFANWLTKGQPGLGTPVPQDINSTEDGSYYLNGATSNGALMAVTRKTVAQGARYMIPTEDEWYKAAYHDKNAGLVATYFDYPTRTSSTLSNVLSNPDPGNNANFLDSNYTIGSPYWRTPVGDFENSESFYGTFDQGGNVWEWNETAVTSSWRGLRGGSFASTPSNALAASTRINYYGPTFEWYTFGFRVASVPEPGSLVLLVSGAVGLLGWAWRRWRA